MSSHQLLRTENRSGHVTIQAPVYIGNHMFKVNNQYEFSKVEIYLVGCGCNGTKKEEKKYYLLTVGSNKYSVEERYVVETDVPIPESTQRLSWIPVRDIIHSSLVSISFSRSLLVTIRSGT